LRIAINFELFDFAPSSKIIENSIEGLFDISFISILCEALLTEIRSVVVGTIIICEGPARLGPFCHFETTLVLRITFF
jgi:hypothetical protein